MLAKAGVLINRFSSHYRDMTGIENECRPDGSSTQWVCPMDDKACSSLKKSAPDQAGHDALNG